VLVISVEILILNFQKKKDLLTTDVTEDTSPAENTLIG